MAACVLPHVRHETPLEHQSRTWLGVGFVVAVCLAVEVVSGLVTAAALQHDWYRTLPKPTWTPPDAVFGPAWTALYLTAAAAAALVWAARDREDVCCPLAGFGLQLAAGLAWTVLFFGLQSPVLAFLDVLALWVLVGLTALHFFEVSRPAGWLMVPGWLGVTFAAALNAAVLAA